MYWLIWSITDCIQSKVLFLHDPNEFKICYHHSAIGSRSLLIQGYKFKSQLSHITFMEIDHEIVLTAIFLLQLIQEVHKVLVNHLED